MKSLFFLSILLPLYPSLFIISSAPASPPPARPFPQHTVYCQSAILPDHISRGEMDDSVRSFYRQWKEHYIRESCVPGEKYVWFEGTKGNNICVSEGQGYGMVITALMAGVDPDAQATFDALFRYYQSHPAQSNPRLMAWCQNNDCRSIDGSTATDGDMDIAYSLLLADAQWGLNTEIPYKQKAIEMMTAIRNQEVNPETYVVMESNTSNPHTRDYFDMRSSDFMPDHIRAFRKASGEAIWDSVLDNNYRVFRYLQDTYSPEVGLVPDFIKKVRLDSTGTTVVSAVPAQPNYLESKYDGVYNFNACRVPWRIATDYLVSGDRRAADFLTKINHWVRETTGNNPDNISAGYDLDGNDLPHRNFEALCFIAPFAVSAMVDKENQPWLNKVWDYLVHFKRKDFDYYDNSIKMLTMIILSGNYWTPQG